MSRKHRFQKTQNRKLSDLDDHLYFLKEALAKLAAGDEAYLKSLAAELRVLVCEASRTEGLLWRIIDELHVHDAVHVHLAGDLDREHPLARGMQFCFYRIFRAGHGNPSLVPANYSLKGIIKEHEALVVLGTGYTHEKLIRAVAEQMGSAHEDEGAEPHLVELSSTIISSRPILITLLVFDAELVLEVGERALADAVQKVNFVRKIRPAIAVPQHHTNVTPNVRSSDFEGASVSVPGQGTLAFVLDHPHHPDWWINSTGYDFGTFARGTLSVRAKKHPDKTIELCVEGLSDSIIETRKEIPITDQPVSVVVSWNGSEVNFYVCGECADTIEYQPKG
jgi:hypothetical protein